MRPRPDAAENSAVRIRNDRQACASMRPRPDAAENGRIAASARGIGMRFNEAAARCRGKRCGQGYCFYVSSSFNEAAARCRGKRPTTPTTPTVQYEASMRPRPDAAENASDSPARPSAARRFNEAAARCRGKRVHGSDRSGRFLASMRPRPDAAENLLDHALPEPSLPGRFNEAAARCRGKPWRRPRRRRTGRGFNEAAARCRGKRATARIDASGRRALQ